MFKNHVIQIINLFKQFHHEYDLPFIFLSLTMFREYIYIMLLTICVLVCVCSNLIMLVQAIHHNSQNPPTAQEGNAPSSLPYVTT